MAPQAGSEHVPRPDLPALHAAAESVIGAPVEFVEAMSGGERRDTYRVVAATGERSVLRLDRDADSLAKEVALTSLVGDTVPVPRVVGTDLEGDLVGVPLTVSGYAEGESLDEALAGAGEDEASAIGEAVGHTLADIGSFTFDMPGLLGPALVPEPLDASLPGLLVATGERVLHEDGARDALGGPVADGYQVLLQEAAPTLQPVAAQSALVHSDFNAKNLVIDRAPDGTPLVAAVLDWEFAFSGPPLADVGNMLRRQERLPTPFCDAFVAGFSADDSLPPGWRSIAAALDALALLDLLDRGTRGEHGPTYTEACALIDEAVGRGDLAPPPQT
jgi:aminoglycoside phosphotransferase (APT) family kinase protein